MQYNCQLETCIKRGSNQIRFGVRFPNPLEHHTVLNLLSQFFFFHGKKQYGIVSAWWKCYDSAEVSTDSW